MKVRIVKEKTSRGSVSPNSETILVFAEESILTIVGPQSSSIYTRKVFKDVLFVSDKLNDIPTSASIGITVLANKREAYTEADHEPKSTSNGHQQESAIK